MVNWRLVISIDLIIGFFVPATAQAPELSVRLDIRPTYAHTNSGKPLLRWYDRMGRYSTVTLQLKLQKGWKVVVAERFQKIDHDSDGTLLDEAYLEDPGEWRVGKQYLPIGNRELIRESVPALRLDTHILIDDLPISIALCDGGVKRPRGVVGRLGKGFGVSFAVGDNFASSGSALCAIRIPENPLGSGQGYRNLYGADFIIRALFFTINGEYFLLRKPINTLDREFDISDVRVNYRIPGLKTRLTAAWSRIWQSNLDFYRLEGEMTLSKTLSIMPFVRFKQGKWQDLGLSARIKL